MDSLSRLMTALWYVDICCAGMVLFRLGYLRIHQRYPGLVAFLAMDVVMGCMGLRYGMASLIYYWTYFIASSLLGSALLIRMCREMFAELYCRHAGLRGLTQCRLRRSILIGSAVCLALAPPVGILHWGDPEFECWQFPFFDLHRCLTFGVVAFVVTMWRKLRALPLDIPSNVSTYARSTCAYLTCSGLVETVVLIMHKRLATMVCSVILLAASLAFYGSLVLFLRRPNEIRQVDRFAVDPEEVAWLSSISSLFARVDEAQRRGRASAVRRLPFFVILSSLHSVWKACARAGGIMLGLVQKGVSNGRTGLRGEIRPPNSHTGTR
jgi:hypothetical protein